MMRNANNIDLQMRKKYFQTKIRNDHERHLFERKCEYFDKQTVSMLEYYLTDLKKTSDQMKNCRETTGWSGKSEPPTRQDFHTSLVDLRTNAPWSYCSRGTIEDWEKIPGRLDRIRSSRGGRDRTGTVRSAISSRPSTSRAVRTPRDMVDAGRRPATSISARSDRGGRSVVDRSSGPVANGIKYSATHIRPATTGVTFRSNRFNNVEGVDRATSGRSTMSDSRFRTQRRHMEQSNSKLGIENKESIGSIEPNEELGKKTVKSETDETMIPEIKPKTLRSSWNKVCEHSIGIVHEEQTKSQTDRKMSLFQVPNLSQLETAEKLEEANELLQLETTEKLPGLDSTEEQTKTKAIKFEDEPKIKDKSSSSLEEDLVKEIKPKLMRSRKKTVTQFELPSSHITSDLEQEKPAGREEEEEPELMTTVSSNPRPDYLTPRFYVRPQERYKQEKVFLMKRYLLLQRQKADSDNYNPNVTTSRLKINLVFSQLARKRALKELIEENTAKVRSTTKREADRDIQEKVEKFLDSIDEFIKENSSQFIEEPAIGPNNDTKQDLSKH